MPAKNGIEQPGGHLSRWWRNSRYFQLGQGYPFAKGESGIVHDTFWKAKAFAAWTYELVRRLPCFKAIEKRIAANDLSVIKMLPPFPQLTYTEVNCLLGAVLERPPIRIVRSRHPSAQANYTAPLPPVSFDRSVLSRKAILEFVGQWIDAEDKRLGLPVLTGPEGGKSRNRDQKYQLGDWRWVESAEPRDGVGGPPFDKTAQRIRAKAKRHGLKYYRRVLLALGLARANILHPIFSSAMTGLGNKEVSKARLESALKRLSLRKPNP